MRLYVREVKLAVPPGVYPAEHVPHTACEDDVYMYTASGADELLWSKMSKPEEYLPSAAVNATPESETITIGKVIVSSSVAESMSFQTQTEEG